MVWELTEAGASCGHFLLLSGWWSGVTLHTLHVFSHTGHLGVWHRMPLQTAVLRHWHFQQVFVALFNSSIQLLGPLLCFGVGKVEVSLEGLPQCCGVWERFPYRTVFFCAVCFYHVPHSFRHFGRDLCQVFWASYLYEAA